MIRRFLPLILPIACVMIFAAISHGFWQKGSVGMDMSELPAIELGGESIVLFHPRGLKPGHPDFRWRVSIGKSSLARLGALELAYGIGPLPPPAESWVPMPVGTAFGAFEAAPGMPAAGPGNRDSGKRLWIRARSQPDHRRTSILLEENPGLEVREPKKSVQP